LAATGFAEENGVIELRAPVGRGQPEDWGRDCGDGTWKLVEIADDRGQMLDSIWLSESQLKLVAKYSD
jgi:hypothetical protein